MIDVALRSVTGRWHLREGMPIREIARRTGLSRNAIRKYLANQNLEPSYPDRKSPSKLDDWTSHSSNHNPEVSIAPGEVQCGESA